MKRFLCLCQAFCIVALCLLTGCQSNDTELYEQLTNQAASEQTSEQTSRQDAAASSQDKPLSGTLRVSTYYDEEIRERAEEFEQLYPEVQIEVSVAQQSGSVGESWEDYLQRTSVEMMSGQSADIVDLAQMSVSRYAKSGLLCNLYDFMEMDSDFHSEDYYANIFKAKEYDGGLYSLPFYFLYDMTYLSRPLLEEAGLDAPDALDYEKMLDLYRQVSDKAGKDFSIMPGIISEWFFKYEFPAYYDIETGTANFDSPEFISYLKRTKEEIPKLENVADWDITRVAGGVDDFMQEDYLFCNYDVTSIDTYNMLIDYPNILPPVPMCSHDGQFGFSTLQADYGIVRSCENKELAWEFLKYCISEKQPPESLEHEAVMDYTGQFHAWVPINIQNFYHSFTLECNYYRSIMTDVTNWKQGDPQQLTEQAVEQIHEWNLQRNFACSETEIFGLLQEELNNYYQYDLATAEETAKSIQTKMNIFLNE